jgi:hypothetical protein
MDVAYMSALSALAGSAIGGLTSGVTTWLNQRSLARAGQLAHELSRRQELYRDFKRSFHVGGHAQAETDGSVRFSVCEAFSVSPTIG